MPGEELTVRIPLRTGRGQNEREHFMQRSRRVKAERWAVHVALNGLARIRVPCTVLLTRVGPSRRPLDSDNLSGAMKAVRDQVANWLGVDDGSDAVKWSYAQARQKNWSVEICVKATKEDHGKTECEK